MRVGKVCVVALALAAGSCSLGDKKTYFTCNGRLTKVGAEPRTIRGALLLVNSYNDIPTVLGRKEKQGYILLKDVHLGPENPLVWDFDFKQWGDTLQLSGDSTSPSAEGSFDLISRQLEATVSGAQYNLHCGEARPADI
jgi:hypothetical protein